MTSKATSKRKYEMKFAGQLIKHLGLQMYGGAVPAIAELISNSWDAMARNIWVELPVDRPLEESDTITVRDDGRGMSYQVCNNAYLYVGRERRRVDGDWTEEYNGLEPRRLQGRKGIGKLAGFGIANRIEVRTVSNGEMSHFAMDYEKMTRTGEFVSDYLPDALQEDGKKTKEKPGTCVTLRQLRIDRSISLDEFTRSMARRFAILSTDFVVHVNGKKVTREEFPFQFRFPAKPGEWETVSLSNGHDIRWWAGFCVKPIADEGARGFVVFVRGKLAQTPWFFDLSGGAWGQHGMQYLSGEVRADYLDETEGLDLIATDRATVRWEHPLAYPLKEWGEKKVRSLLEMWADMRRKSNVKRPRVAEYVKLAEHLPSRERYIFKQFVDRVCSIPQLDEFPDGREIVDELIEFGYNALTNRTFIEIIRQLNAASPEDRKKLDDALVEWDIIEAVTTALLVKGRVEIIRKFSRMIEAKIREKPDMHDYLKKHPWLIDPKWTTLVHERSLDNVICKHFGLLKSKTKDGRKRLDFFCLGDRHQTAYVVELKGPDDLIGRKEMDQLRDYVLFLRKHLPGYTIKGLLICDRVSPDDDSHAKIMQDSGVADIRNWGNLLFVAEQMHEEFLAVVKDRAPADDPRLAGLDAEQESRGRTKDGAGSKD